MGLLARQLLVHLLVREGRPKLLLETVGVDKVLFETDFPHPTALYPNVQEHIVDTLGGYSHEVRKQVLERNAATLYNLPF